MKHGISRKCGICIKEVSLRSVKDFLHRGRNLYICRNCLDYLEAFNNYYLQREYKEFSMMSVDINTIKQRLSSLEKIRSRK